MKPFNNDVPDYTPPPEIVLPFVGEVRMDLNRNRLVRIIRDKGADFYVAMDIMTNIRVLLAPDEIGEETYNEMEVVAWAANLDA